MRVFDDIAPLLEQQAIELPSWAFGNFGTRFKVFSSPGTPRTVEEKMADAATVHRFTGLVPVIRGLGLERSPAGGPRHRRRPGAGVPRRRTVHIVGGGSQNALLCQLTAGRTVYAGPVEATAIGNVLVQARAAGLVMGSLEALRSIVATTFEPVRYVPQVLTPSAFQ